MTDFSFFIFSHDVLAVGHESRSFRGPRQDQRAVGGDGKEGTDGNEGGCERVCVLRFEDLAAEVRKKIEQAIERTQPTGFGQRYARLFLLARMLKKIDPIKDRSGEDIMFIADMWHERALPNIEHKSLIMTRERLRNAWADAKYPPGEGKSLEIAQTNAQKADFPMPELADYAGDVAVEGLIRLCFELQRLAGLDEEWFIPTNKAPELLGISHSWLAIMLNTLEGNGIIRKTKKHTPKKCTRYVYTGPSIKLLQEEAA